MTVIEFLLNLLGLPYNSSVIYIYYIGALILTLILLDGIITFLVGALSGLFYRNKY